MTISLSINYSLPESSLIGALTMEEVPRKSGGITKTEAAQLANAVAGRDPCGTDAPTNDVPPQRTVEETQALAAEALAKIDALRNAIWCDEVKPGLSVPGLWLTKVIVTTTPVGLAYDLRGADIVIGPGKIEEIPEMVSVNIVGKTSVQAPVTTGVTAGFTGRVFDMDGREITPPAIIINNGFVVWGLPVVGAIAMTYQVSKIVHDITCSASPVQLVAFYPGGAEMLTLASPTEDANDLDCKSLGTVEDGTPCTIKTAYSHYCSCGGGRRPELDYDTVEEIACDGTGNKLKQVDVYVDCSSHDQDDDFFDPDYYEATCCEPGTPPACKERITQFTGECPPKDNYPEDTIFLPVSQPSGPCGVHTETWEVNAIRCCDVVEPVLIDEANSADIIADNSVGTIITTGGKLPFEVSVVGNEFWLDAAHTQKKITLESGESFQVFTGLACGSGKFTITDSCGVQVRAAVRSVTGEWNDNCYGLIVDYQNNTPSAFSGYPVDNSQTCNGPQTYGSYIRSSWQRISVVAVKRWSSWTSSWYYTEYSDPRNKIVAELDAALLNVTCPIGIYNDPGVENIPLGDPTGAANTCDPANPCEWIC